jgi:invasion protein IalB
MKRIWNTAVCLAGFCLMGGAVLAQDAPTPPTAETAQAGQVYLAETMAPWELRCTKTTSGKDPCQIFQALRNDTGASVAEFNMFAVPDGQGAAAGAVIIVPLETALDRGLILKVDDKEARGWGFDFCNSYGCVVRAGFTAAELEEMKAGTKAVLSITPMADRDTPVELTLNLEGFSAAIDKTVPKP